MLLSLSIVVLCACKAQTQTSTPLKTVTAPQGGKIVYGTVAGATTQAAAMSSILRNVHNNCGEKPQVGQVFQFKGMNSVGVFFTVTNHPGGNRKVAGLVIANASGPRQVEAALLSDDASRFGKTVNPMLQQLFGVWHPGGAGAATSGSPAGAKTASASGPAGGGGSAPAAALHMVSASDNSASIGIADGWRLLPNSGRGAIGLQGPNGEQVNVRVMKGAIDPTHPFRARSDAHGQLEGPPGAVVIYPYRGDPAREFEGILQAWRRSNGRGPVKLQGLKTQIVDNPLRDTNQCVTADGQVDLQDGTGMQKLFALLCVYNERTTFRQWGNYVITFYQLNYVPIAVAQKDNALISAMANTYKQNDQVMQQQGKQMMAQKQQSDQQWRDWGQQQSDRIRAQSQAMQKSNADRQAAYDDQHAGYWAQQNSNAAQHANWNAGQDAQARNNQAFSNYLLDQTVVQDNNMYNNGTVGHGTVWNSTADALVKADPNRFSLVTTPNYWKGNDF
ncbi:MAG: hypothetical protein ABSH46_14120 [Bryobacteraceae bacterium]